MDIYRFFHPHHNPRLHSTPLRQHELCELLQASGELRKALERAQQRIERKSTPPLLPQHFTDLLRAMHFVESSLETLVDAHEGDSRGELIELIAERADFPGWENWISLVQQQLAGTQPEPASEEGADVPPTELLRKVG
jgi:hypothetical protein